MKVSNIDKVEELIREHRSYERFYYDVIDYMTDMPGDATPNEHVEILVQGKGFRKQTKTLTIYYGDPLFDDILKAIESKINRIDDELEKL